MGYLRRHTASARPQVASNAGHKQQVDSSTQSVGKGSIMMERNSQLGTHEPSWRQTREAQLKKQEFRWEKYSLRSASFAQRASRVRGALEQLLLQREFLRTRSAARVPRRCNRRVSNTPHVNGVQDLIGHPTTSFGSTKQTNEIQQSAHQVIRQPIRQQRPPQTAPLVPPRAHGARPPPGALLVAVSHEGEHRLTELEWVAGQQNRDDVIRLTCFFCFPYKLLPWG